MIKETLDLKEIRDNLVVLFDNDIRKTRNMKMEFKF